MEEEAEWLIPMTLQYSVSANSQNMFSDEEDVSDENVCKVVTEDDAFESRPIFNLNDPKFRVIVESTSKIGFETVLVVKGEVEGKEDVPVRIHSECFTGDTLGSLLCDCGQQLRKYMWFLKKSECGVLVYCKGHEGRGIGLYHKLRWYSIQSKLNLDTID